MTLSQEQTINTKAAAWTIGVHILLFLLFFLLKYSLPAPQPVEELGMEVNLGTSDNGLGDDQPMSVDAPSEANLSKSFNASTQQNNDAKEMMTSNDADAPTIAPVKTDHNSVHHNAEENITHKNNKSTLATNNTHNRPQQERPKYVYHGSNGPGGNNAITNKSGGNEGNTTGEGDRGVPGGTPGATNYVGSPGNGTGGISHTLSGRDISPKQFVAEFNEGGRVVIRVTVDRAGNIVAKTVKSSPSAALSRLALQKLSQAKFTPNNDAAPQQFGEITIVFKTHSK